ncbi:adhesion G-protein coupled receptor G6 isoform X2 [Synchiropus splendidus]|uniref:adhesion G-protein coupled receptor G6 isoform X2 n=1 Tax=Synchiropus splendidus TaxID=270530 RepID=UPI00237EC6F0|nr:adhesion G-protein coupled receptor G6 isoform X2 [Synchiropus splendidus]
MCSGPHGSARGWARVLLWLMLGISPDRHVWSCGSSSCDLLLTQSPGQLTSPCYPQKYPNSLSCRWRLQAPAGSVVQLSFLDFELEEAPGCIYDRLVVNTGHAHLSFCGPTASGLTLNSSQNVMELLFTSDFSVQKRGFLASVRHVAVALRNQKVTLAGSSGGGGTEASGSVSIPELSQLTVCFELEGLQHQQQRDWIFSYWDGGGSMQLGLALDQSGVLLSVGGVTCFVESVVTAADFSSSSMRSFCILWSSVGTVAAFLDGSYWSRPCAASRGHSVPGGGNFRLGGRQHPGGSIYNLRLWDAAMAPQELRQLSCWAPGNVLDWDNSYWEVPPGQAQTDGTLSCSVSPPHSPDCSTPGSGCPAASSSADATNTLATNLHVPDLSKPKPPLPTASMSLTISSSIHTMSTASSRSPSPPSSRSPASSVSDSFADVLFYRVSMLLELQEPTPSRDHLQSAVSLWLNDTFHNWTHEVDVDAVSLLPLGAAGHVGSFSCRALLLHYYVSNQSLDQSLVSERISRHRAHLGAGLLLRTDSIRLALIENCVAETTLHYRWPGTRPGVTHLLPCFPNKEETASRTCLIDSQEHHSYWSPPDTSNCTDIDDLQVSAESAAGVAQQLAVISDNPLSTEEVSKIVSKLHQIVNVAKLNVSLASTVVSIISNVLSSETSLVTSSERALRTVEELLQRVDFEGPSLAITSRHLSLGILTFNVTNFNGTSFSAFRLPNSSDPQISFDSDSVSPLAQVFLPPSLLSGLSLDSSSRTRIHFMFFSSVRLFQSDPGSQALGSYVVASSVSNLSIRGLTEPVQIQIAHLTDQPPLRPVCVFWDFNLSGGVGGWSSDGCRLSPASARQDTSTCLCDHLTHFGILMDISGISPHMDQRTTQVLTFVTYVGCGISAVFSAATLLTYLAFQKLRRDYPAKILMNLSTSLLFLNLVFLLDGWLSAMHSHGLCVSVALFLHYFLLTSFTWMGLESVHMYIALVKVFNTYVRRYMLKFCLLGWGVPALLVATVLAVNQDSYGLQEFGGGASGEQASEFCWIQSAAVFYSTCVGYFCLIFLLNTAMFVVVMMQICGRSGQRSKRSVREEVLRNLRSVVSLTFLLGMTWGFALFAWGPVSVAFIYLFSIFNSLQGFFIFIFHCLLKENVQNQWKKVLWCSPPRLSENSDSRTAKTQKVSSERLNKSVSSTSFSTGTNWTCKTRSLTWFTRRDAADTRASGGPEGSSSEAEPNSSMLPVSQMIDKMRGYCSARSENFYKNILMSDTFNNSTGF